MCVFERAIELKTWRGEGTRAEEDSVTECDRREYRECEEVW